MKCRGVVHTNPAVSAAQYGMAQAVLSGQSTAMPVSVARELVDKTPHATRSKFARELAGNPRNPMTLHDRMVSVLTEYDRKEEEKALRAKPGRGYHNKYALGHYMNALHEVDADLARGVPVRKAVTGHFTGRLADKLLKVAGEGKTTREEQRGSLADYGFNPAVAGNPSIYDYEDATREGRQAGIKFKQDTGADPSVLDVKELRKRFKIWWDMEGGKELAQPPDKAGNEARYIRAFKYATRKVNPESDSASMYESFHGTPSTGELVIQDQIHYHGNLAELGVLCGLKVRVVTGYDVTLEFGGMPGQGQGENPAKFRVSVFSKGTGFYSEGSKVFSSRSVAHKYFEDVAQEGYKAVLVSDDTKVEYVSGMTMKEAKVYAVPGRKLNRKHKSKRGPLTTAYTMSSGIIPAALGIGDSVIRGVTGNPKPISQMTAGEINKALDKIDAQGSQITAAFIAAGRGDERPSEYLSKTDVLSQKALANYQAHMALRNEMERRYGPGTPSRLPKGFGPIKQNRRGNPGSDTGPVILCTNESGNQLYLRGGDQTLDLDSIKMADYSRDHMVIGEVWGLAYSTKKDFDQFAEVEYVHILGLEKYHQKLPRSADLWEDALPPYDEAFGSGNLPTLNYDTLNQALSLVGGIYKIDRPFMGTSPGIEN